MRNRGHSLVELVVGLFILVPVALILIDLVILITGMEINDNVCREAARLVAAGDPVTASSRAMSVIDAANGHSPGIISDFRLLDVKLYPATLVAQEASLQPYGGTLVGSVTISTTSNIHLFVVSWILKRASHSFALLQRVFHSPTLFPIPPLLPILLLPQILNDFLASRAFTPIYCAGG